MKQASLMAAILALTLLLGACQAATQQPAVPTPAPTEIPPTETSTSLPPTPTAEPTQAPTATPTDAPPFRSLIESADLGTRKGPVYSQGWSPDGRLLVTADYDQIRVWDATTRQEVGVLSGHSSYVWGLAWQPAAAGSHSLLASASQDGSLRLWDVSTLTELANMSSGWAFCVSWSPDGTQLAVGTASGEVQIWEIPSQTLLATWRTPAMSAVISVGWSPDGKTIASGALSSEIYLWDLASGQVRTTISGYSQARNDVNGLAWSPDGSRLATAHQDGWVRLWNPETGEMVLGFPAHQGWARGIAWSPDGSLLASTGEDKGIRLWDPLTGQKFTEQHHNWLPVWSVSWSPDGVMVASGAGTYEQPHVGATIVWRVPYQTPPKPAATPTPAILLEYSPQEFTSPETFQAGLGDLDGDGDLDMLLANPMRNPAQLWLNDGNGTFIDSGQQLTQYGHGVGLADLDGDGNLDAFIVCHQTSLPSKIYLNDGTGMLTDSGQDLGDAKISASELNLVDINGDGHMDAHILYYSESGKPDYVYLNDGQAVFSDSGLRLDADTIAWGDLDGDGDMDYFGKDWGERYVVMLNDGRGAFSEGWQMADSLAILGGVALADFDADGDLDALVANGFRDNGSQPSRLFWNDGSGNFTDSGQLFNETMGADLVVGDLDLDGDLDAVIANMDRPNEVWLYEDGSFIDSGLRLGQNADMSSMPELGDLDGDGDLDIVFGRFRGGAEIWLNLTIDEKP